MPAGRAVISKVDQLMTAGTSCHRSHHAQQCRRRLRLIWYQPVQALDGPSRTCYSGSSDHTAHLLPLAWHCAMAPPSLIRRTRTFYKGAARELGCMFRFCVTVGFGSRQICHVGHAVSSHAPAAVMLQSSTPPRTLGSRSRQRPVSLKPKSAHCVHFGCCIESH